MRKKTKYILPGILTFSLLVRFISINQSLWLDEATTALAAKMPLIDLFNKFLPGDFHPPFYYLFMNFWIRVFGTSEISLRTPSVIFGALLVYVIFLISKELTDKKTAEISALFAATSGLLVYYSQEARMYMLAALLVSVAAFSFVKILKKGGVGNWLILALSLALIGLTDYVSLLILPVFWVVGAMKSMKFDWWKKFMASHIILLVSAVFWGGTFIKQLKSGLSVSSSSPAWWQVLGQASFKNAALIPVKFMLGRISFENHYIYALVVAVSGTLFLYILFKAIKSLSFVWIWLTLPAILGIIISFKIPTLSYFRFLFCMPALYILLASGLEKIGKYKFLFILAVLAVNILSASFYLFNPRFQREDWRAAAEAVGSDQIIFPGQSHEEAIIYYGKKDQIVNVFSLDSKNGTVWLSRYVHEIADPNDEVRKKIEDLGYTKVGEYDFNGVIFWKYMKTQYAGYNTLLFG